MCVCKDEQTNEFFFLIRNSNFLKNLHVLFHFFFYFFLHRFFRFHSFHVDVVISFSILIRSFHFQ